MMELNQGSLCIVDRNQQIVWCANPLNTNGVTLQIQNNGNLVVLDGNNNIVWQTYPPITSYTTTLKHSTITNSSVYATSVLANNPYLYYRFNDTNSSTIGGCDI